MAVINRPFFLSQTNTWEKSILCGFGFGRIFTSTGDIKSYSPQAGARHESFSCGLLADATQAHTSANTMVV
jgi:hypothetical protein